MAQALQDDSQPKNIRKMLSQTHVALGLSLCSEVSRIKAHPFLDLGFDLHTAKVSNPEASTTGKFGGEIDNPKSARDNMLNFSLAPFLTIASESLQGVCNAHSSRYSSKPMSVLFNSWS